MAQDIKIPQTPPVEVKDKNLSNQEPHQIDIRQKEIQQVKINTEKLHQSKRILEKKLTKSSQDQTLSIKGKGEDKKAPEKFSTQDLNNIKQATNEVLAQINIQLDFTMDRELNKIIVKVINKETGKVIRQIPPEEMLKIAKRMEEMSGVLLDKWS